MNDNKNGGCFIVLILIIFIVVAAALSSCSHHSSTSSKTYTCGYCGRKMEGYYYDYINGKYACYSCSKALRN